MTSQNIVTPQSLIQTQNGKQFYIFSGEQTVTSVENFFINIDNIGERDIEIALEIANANNLGSDNLTTTVYINDIVVHRDLINNTYSQNLLGFNELRLIIPANTSLKVGLVVNANSYNYTIAGHGKYLSIE
tara:strand:- start:222 stop:614 length:393 start_codon:yes stop_codon:yes gene_type:complete